MKPRTGDPKFQPDQDEFAELISNLTSPEYAKHFADKITNHTLEFEEYEPAFEVVEDAGTAQISIMDSSGMATSVTSTINTILGSGIVGPTTGRTEVGFQLHALSSAFDWPKMI